MNLLKLIPYLFFIFIALTACKTSQQNKGTEKNADKLTFTVDYYNKLSNNLERVQKLYSGLFVQYRDNTKENSYKKWAFNDSEDSMMLYCATAGIANKHGYWVYQRQFISFDPDKPVYTGFLKIESTDNRDSITASGYDSEEEYTWEQVKTPGFFDNINFSELKSNGEVICFVKENNASFKGLSVRSPMPLKNSNTTIYVQHSYHLTPDDIAFGVFRFEKEDDPQEKGTKSSITDHFRRLVTRTNLFFKAKK